MFTSNPKYPVDQSRVSESIYLLFNPTQAQVEYANYPHSGPETHSSHQSEIEHRVSRKAFQRFFQIKNEANQLKQLNHFLEEFVARSNRLVNLPCLHFCFIKVSPPQKIKRTPPGAPVISLRPFVLTASCSFGGRWLTCG